MWLDEHSGTVAAGLAILGVGVTSWLSGRAALKAKDTPVPDDKKGKVKRFVSVYGPAIFSGIVTSGLIVASDRIHANREIALGSMLSVAAVRARDADELERKVRERLGNEEVEGLKREVVKERMEKTEIPKNDNPSNYLLVYEPYTDQYIWTSREAIAWTMLEANKKLAHTLDCRLNFIVKMLGGKPKKKGDEIGWNWENEIQDYNWSYFGGPWIQIDPVLKDEGYGEVFHLYYQVEPEEQNYENMIYSEV